MIVVVKIGTSSLTDDLSRIKEEAIAKLCNEVAEVRSAGHQVVIVTSAAITAGLPAMGYGTDRPKDSITLQAAAAVGQSRLLRVYDDALAKHELVGGQILLSPYNFFQRPHYLHARQTLTRLLQLGIIPIVNENDAVIDDEIRFGDNDRISAIVANAVNADLLVLLTDTPGLFTSDPRLDSDASLVEEVFEINRELELAAGGAGTARGSGGMASKIAAARMASWSGIRTVIAGSERENVVVDAVAGIPGVGTVVHAKQRRLPARKVWIAFAQSVEGRIIVDTGARKALVTAGKSLLPAGVVGVEGSFDPDSGVEIADETGSVFAKGITHFSAPQLRECLGLQTGDLEAEFPHEVVHRDDMVVLTEI